VAKKNFENGEKNCEICGEKKILKNKISGENFAEKNCGKIKIWTKKNKK
jgi:hypothetical protein